MMHRVVVAGLVVLTIAACSPSYDVVIRNGTIYDGSGGDPYVGDLAISGDSIVAVGTVAGNGRTEIDATGLAVSPGFVNVIAHPEETLIADGRGESDIRQGVTLEIMGEGESMGPWNDSLKAYATAHEGDIKYDIPWTTLDEYLRFLVDKGVSPNVASFVGAATIRENVLGFANRDPTPDELTQMQALVRQAMEDGALGVASALIYAPGFYAKTPELTALAAAAAPYGGIYISHIRSEGNQFLQAIDELLTIARDANVPAEIYHFKAAGQANWPKLDQAIAKIEEARAQGLQITADMYTYTAGATGLDAAMPPWVQEGGYDAWATRLEDPAIRRRVIREMRTPTDAWENLLLAAGSPDRVLLVGFNADSLKPLTGKTLADVAQLWNESPEEAAIDLVIKDGSRVGTIYFIMSEENVIKKLKLPWVSFGSDAGAPAPEGVFLKSNPHPRAYGNFARLLGHYVRDERVIPLQEAIRRASAFPAETLKLRRRGALKAGYYADVVVFDPRTIADHATFEKPHQYATGVVDVFVNGTQVVKDGEHTGALPGRVVRGPGWKGN
jgi:N-acyl-D-aspartate/D-glutamate deacylase